MDSEEHKAAIGCIVKWCEAVVAKRNQLNHPMLAQQCLSSSVLPPKDTPELMADPLPQWASDRSVRALEHIVRYLIAVSPLVGPKVCIPPVPHRRCRYYIALLP